MKILLRYRLQLVLPVLLMGFVAMLAGLILLYEWNIKIIATEHNAEKNIALHMTVLQRSVSDLMMRGNSEAAQRELSWFGSLPEVATLVAVDEYKRILLSIRYALQDQRVGEALPAFSELHYNSSRLEARTVLVFSDDRSILHAYYPLILGREPGKFRPTRMGSLYMEYNLAPARAGIARHILYESLLVLSFLGLGMSGLWWLLHRLVTSRINRLVATARRFAAGQEQTRVLLDGADELAEAGKAFDEMARRIQHNSERLRRLNHFYNALGEINQWMLRASSPLELFEAVCRMLVETAQLSVCGIVTESAGNLTLAAQAGNIPASQWLPPSQRPIWLALQENHSVAIEDFSRPPLASAAFFPLRQRGQVVGTLNLYAAETGFFNSEVRDLLTEISADISFALDNFILAAQRQAAEEALRRERELFRKIVDRLPVMLFRYSAGQNILLINHELERLLGWSEEEARQLDVFARWFPDPARRREMLAYLDTEQAAWQDFQITTRRSELLDSAWSGIGLQDGTRIAIGIDLRERKRAENALRSSESLLKSILKAAPVGIGLAQNRRLAWVSAEMLAMTGYSEAELLGRNTRMLYPGKTEYMQINELLNQPAPADKVLATDSRWLRRDGKIIDIHLRVTALEQDGLPGSQIFSALDITERKRAEARVQHLAYYDPLTGLANRRLLAEQAASLLRVAQAEKRAMAVMYLDLDRFKYVNDTQGHEAGDLLLIETAQRLRECIENQDILARLGGDEFAFVLLDADLVKAAEMAGKILGALDKPFWIKGQEMHIGGSIGITRYPVDGTDLDTLYKHADIAMYQAKGHAQGYSFFNETLARKVRENVVLEQSLQRALGTPQFMLHYQPRVDLRSGAITSVECLLRWQHPELGLIPPSTFIPLAEHTNLIHILGLWVLQQAAAQAQAWQQAGFTVRLAVNVSGREIQRPGFIRQARETLQQAGVSGAMMELEITETAAMAEMESGQTVLRQIKELGMHVSVDDFGTGYSSFMYLKHLPVDSLKIDPSFLAGIAADTQHSRDAGIVRAIIALAKSLGLSVIAEGVETPAQQKFLQQAGCDQAQGFLYTPAIPAAELEALLRAGKLELGNEPSVTR
jgi:diguanylate cyclase (GGDEF)-like protein/PAS domain S-box-containing protein